MPLLKVVTQVFVLHQNELLLQQLRTPLEEPALQAQLDLLTKWVYF